MTRTRRHPNVINVSEVEPVAESRGSRFGHRGRRLGLAAGARATACNFFEVDPGRSAFPSHYHFGIEESIYVLEGSGRLTIGQTVVEVGPGDYITFPAGPESAHQLVNSGTEPLRYLCFANHAPVEVLVHTDSNKLCVTAYAAPGTPPAIRACLPKAAGVDYYDGEDIG